MTDDLDHDLPSRDHNEPPSDLLLRTSELVANANRWLKERPKLTTDEEGGACDDFLGQLRENQADVKAAKQAEAKPHDEALDVIRAKYADSLELLDMAIRRLRALAGDFLRAKKNTLASKDAERQERARQALADAERLSREALKPGATLEAGLAAKRAHETAEQAAREASRKQKAQVRGDYSKKALHLTTRWRAEVIDDAKALAHFAEHPEVRLAALDAIRKVAGAMARELKDEGAAPPGIKFVKEETA
jgi:hypothetical protein